MKKVLALVLVAVLAVGMGMSGFATVVSATPGTLNNLKDFYSGYTLKDGLIDNSKNVGTWYNNNTYRWGDQFALDEPELVINLKRYMFDGWSDETYTDYSLWAVDFNVLVNRGFISSYELTQILSPNFNNADRINQLNTYLTSANVWIDATTQGAARTSGYQNLIIRGDSELNLRRSLELYNAINAAFQKDLTNWSSNWNWNTWTDVESYINQDVSNVYFASFVWWNWNGNDYNDTILGDEDTTKRNLTSDEIQRNRIDFGTQVSGNSDTIKEIKLDRSKGQIIMKLQDEWVSTKYADLEVLIYLIIDGKRFDNKGVLVTARLQNPEILVYASHDRVDISKGYIANAVEFNEKIAVYVGNGATIHTKFFKDKLYYGITTRDADDAADIVFRQYKDVDNVLTFKVVGLNNTGDYVTLSTDYADYYVYDEDMNYLGRGDEQLDYSAKFYLANKKLDIEGDEDDEYEEDTSDYTAPSSQPAVNPDMGGDSVNTPNVNANPGTGR